jgi:hypothetical protein
MTWPGLESTIPASERAKTAHALDRSATVTRVYKNTVSKPVLTIVHNAVRVSCSLALQQRAEGVPQQQLHPTSIAQIYILSPHRHLRAMLSSLRSWEYLATVICLLEGPTR